METTTKPTFNYTQHAWEGSNYKKTEHLSYKDIAKLIRQQLKKKFPKCKFSVSKESYAGGGSITVSLMSAPFKAFKEVNMEVCERQSLRGMNYKPEDIAKMWQDTINRGYDQVNQYHISDDYRMSDEAKEVVTIALGIAQSYNFDDSDAQIDYFHTNFYLHPSIGKWDKPFIQSK